MDRTAAREVEARKIVQPPSGISRPAATSQSVSVRINRHWNYYLRNGAVDNGNPAEAENDRRENATTLERATDNDHGGAGREHQLVETKENVRNVCTTTTGGRQDLSPLSVRITSFSRWSV